jgi:hypothetical protein
MVPRALIAGITGQPGSYVSDLLLQKGYDGMADWDLELLASGVPQKQAG